QSINHNRLVEIPNPAQRLLFRTPAQPPRASNGNQCGDPWVIPSRPATTSGSPSIGSTAQSPGGGRLPPNGPDCDLRSDTEVENDRGCSLSGMTAANFPPGSRSCSTSGCRPGRTSPSSQAVP